jgi:hypothetical protein
VLRCCLLLLACAACAGCIRATPSATQPPATATLKPRAALLRESTLTPRPIDQPTHTATAAPSETPAPSATATPAPTLTNTPGVIDSPTAVISTFSPTLTEVCGEPCGAAKTPEAAALPVEFATSPTLTPTTSPPIPITIGYSGEGRPLTAVRFGSGARVLLLVGGIHGGWEGNTVMLANQLIEYFTANPQAVPPGVSVVIVPVANPDGYARGRIFTGRLNSAGVDLNRNWACNWLPTAYWQQARVNPGAGPMSEPETQALSAYILQIQPRAALFYHSSANGVFAGECGGDHGSAAMSALYGAAAGYRYGSPFVAYPVTGTASDWLDGQGIPSADVELITGYDSEFARNLAGVLALLRWLEEK